MHETDYLLVLQKIPAKTVKQLTRNVLDNRHFFMFNRDPGLGKDDRQPINAADIIQHSLCKRR